LGRGGQARVVEATGLSTSTVNTATQAVRGGMTVEDRVRAAGAGPKRAVDTQPGLLVALDELVRRLLHQLRYSLQAPSKQKEGSSHPDRDSQFRYINDLAADFIASGEPVVSVDTKKKELIGEYAKAVPYGIYDLANNEGWVSVGDTADTAEFAVESLRRWWHRVGAARFPHATRLLITVCHSPPGTSKWNKIEHRMFSFITSNWRTESLTSIRTIVELIARTTTTATGLTIQAAYDPNWYPTGVKVTDTELAALPLNRHDWHGDWNYTFAHDGLPPMLASSIEHAIPYFFSAIAQLTYLVSRRRRVQWAPWSSRPVPPPADPHDDPFVSSLPPDEVHRPGRLVEGRAAPDRGAGARRVALRQVGSVVRGALPDFPRPETVTSSMLAIGRLGVPLTTLVAPATVTGGTHDCVRADSGHRSQTAWPESKSTPHAHVNSRGIAQAPSSVSRSPSSRSPHARQPGSSNANAVSR
jgi:hypothetical protein